MDPEVSHLTTGCEISQNHKMRINYARTIRNILRFYEIEAENSYKVKKCYKYFYVQ